MIDPLEEMLRRLTSEHPEIFSSDPLVRPAGIVTVEFSETKANLVASSMEEILKYVGVYTTVDDYVLLDVARETRVALRHELSNDILKRVGQRDLLLSLKTLAIAAESPAKSEHIAQEYLNYLPAPSRIRLGQVLKEHNRIFLYRQQVLAAFRKVILEGKSAAMNQIGPMGAAIMISHAMLDAEDVLEDNTVEEVGGLSAKLTMHLVANQDFNSKEDIIAIFDRAIRLWRDYGPRFAERLGNRDPHEILKTQIGLDIEDMLAVAFGVWSYDLRWNFANPTPLAFNLHPDTDVDLVAAFMSSMSATLDELADDLLIQRSDWDFLPFEMRPIIELADGWLLVDRNFLMGRVTSGLFYFVFDYLKSLDTDLALEWSRIWGDMVEALVRDNVVELAQLQSGVSRPVYSQDDLAVAYPKGGGRADILVDFDETIVAFEVVSGHLTINSRLGLDRNAFDADMEKIVYKKLRQLDGTASNVLNDPTRLLGPATRPLRFQPVVVAGGGFPFNFATSQFIDNFIAMNGLFAQSGVLLAAVIDLSDLEIIEALHEDGEFVADLIRDWKSSSDRHLSFRNWVLKNRGSARARPRRMDAPIHALMGDFSRRLNIEEDDAQGL